VQGRENSTLSLVKDGKASGNGAKPAGPAQPQARQGEARPKGGSGPAPNPRPVVTETAGEGQ
jgi:hypothetical protein